MCQKMNILQNSGKNKKGQSAPYRPSHGVLRRGLQSIMNHTVPGLIKQDLRLLQELFRIRAEIVADIEKFPDE